MIGTLTETRCKHESTIPKCETTSKNGYLVVRNTRELALTIKNGVPMHEMCMHENCKG